MYSQKSHGQYRPRKNIRDQILPKDNVPKELEKCFSVTLDIVVKHYEDKYYKESMNEAKIELGDFDKYIF